MPRPLGQHFLTHKEFNLRIAQACQQQDVNEIVEVGPGHGELTGEIMIACPNVHLTLIEKDPHLVAGLRQTLPAFQKVNIISGDVRIVLPDYIERTTPSSYIVAGNIPYYLTDYLMRLIGECTPRPKACIFTIQKEVAVRLIGGVGEMNKLSASVGLWATARIIQIIPKKFFSPPPKVDSATVLITTKPDAPQPSSHEAQQYIEAMRAVFSQPRKTICNNLTSYLKTRHHPQPRAGANLILEEVKINELARPALCTPSALYIIGSRLAQLLAKE